MKPSWIRWGIFSAILTVWLGIVFAVSYIVTGLTIRAEIPPPPPPITYPHLLQPGDPGWQQHLEDGCRGDPSWSPCAFEYERLHR